MLTPASNDWSLADAAHLLNRAGFGANPDQLHRFHLLGRHAAIAELFDPTLLATISPEPPAWTEPQALAEKIKRQFEMLREARQAMRAKGDKDPEATKEQQKARQLIRRENQQDQLSVLHWWLRLMIHGKAPLREKMTLFWHDHFATSLIKVKQPHLMFQQNQLFRRLALGNFKELTHAIACDPAMMVYLDLSNSNQKNPNENFARELLELFTLGEGHYKEKDITEAARAFTGYRLQRPSGKVRLDPKAHDYGEKIFLGQRGSYDGAKIIDLIFEKERPSRFLAEKLWAWFASDQANEKIIEILAKLIRQHDHAIEPALRQLFASEEFYHSSLIRNQIKGPIDFITQLTQQLEVDLLPPALLLQSLQKLGQVPFLPPNVAGWNEGRAWINTNTLLARYNLAGALCHAIDFQQDQSQKKFIGRAVKRMANSYQGPDYQRIAPPELRKDPTQLVNHLMRRFFQSTLTPQLKARFVEYAQSKSKVQEPMSDANLAELVHLMLSTPQYQLC